MSKRKTLYKDHGSDPDRPKKILVVDDDSAIRQIIRRILEEYGYTVLEAKDGLDGLEMFRRDPQRFQVVFLDLEMPRMNGFDTFREMRAIRNDIPVIVVSGCPPEEYENRLPVAELSGFLSKPFKLNELRCTVGQFVQDEVNPSPRV